MIPEATERLWMNNFSHLTQHLQSGVRSDHLKQVCGFASVNRLSIYSVDKYTVVVVVVIIIKSDYCYLHTYGRTYEVFTDQ